MHIRYYIMHDIFETLWQNKIIAFICFASKNGRFTENCVGPR
jgi:hypothetical protein